MHSCPLFGFSIGELSHGIFHEDKSLDARGVGPVRMQKLIDHKRALAAGEGTQGRAGQKWLEINQGNKIRQAGQEPPSFLSRPVKICLTASGIFVPLLFWSRGAHALHPLVT